MSSTGFAAALAHAGPPEPTSLAGAASFAWFAAAVAAHQRLRTDPLGVDAIVTAPISKASWDLAGASDPKSRAGRFPGHTEFLAESFKSPGAGMLFVGPTLNVLLASVHVPIAKVPGLLTIPRLVVAIELADRACRDMGIGSSQRASGVGPRIAVCGLNPHAGERGLLGLEDDRVIAPAIAQARARGIDASGPWPGDSIFLAAARPPVGKGMYDCVVAMYHDQGLIPVKLIDRERTTNLTVGLSPVGDPELVPAPVRTSPAHGTAFDIAGRTPSVADPQSFVAAVELAIRLAQRQRPV